MPTGAPAFFNAENITITGGTFNTHHGTVINNDNSQHVTNSGPVYNNFGQQTINVPAHDDGEVANYYSFAVSANVCIQDQTAQVKDIP